jgi:hypothetical protein
MIINIIIYLTCEKEPLILLFKGYKVVPFRKLKGCFADLYETNRTVISLLVFTLWPLVKTNACVNPEEKGQRLKSKKFF